MAAAASSSSCSRLSFLHSLRHSFSNSAHSRITPPTGSSLVHLSCSNSNATSHSHKIVLEVKEKLEREHPGLPTGKNGRDDEDTILWFLKDRKFSVHEAISKLTKAIKQDPIANEKLCVFLVEKALSRLPLRTENILGIFDLRGFRVENGDLQFLKFLIDVFYYYYPKRLGQVLFVDAPFIFQPMWQVVKPLLKSYASLVRFCDAETVRKEYFTEDTVPPDFRS